jgi:hypothetical protein
MLCDLCDPNRFPRYYRRFESSPFRRELEDFGTWLVATGYRSKILQSVARLEKKKGCDAQVTEMVSKA